MTPNPPLVHIAQQGTLEGSLDSHKGVIRFLNVPYATVAERWRPAVRPEPWTGVRDATKQGPVAPQPKAQSRVNSRAINSYSDFDFDDETTVFDEKHCLNMNIYVHEDTLKKASTKVEGAAETKAQEKAAVIVFIHGGSFRDGANAMDSYDGSNIVRQSAKLGRPVIVVVPNYRLNFLGNFSCPELIDDIQSDPSLTTDYDRATGNWGLQDQRLAFDWLRTHITTFGGDAQNMTAVGESVGAVSINYHMLIPQHRGLFQRAIMQSCAMNSAPAVRSDVEGKLYFGYLVEHFNIPQDLSGKEKLELLKKIPGKELGEAADSHRLRMFTPYVDGVMVQEDVRIWTHKTELYDRGVKAVMVGDTKDEGTMFVECLGSSTKDGYPRLYEKYCPPNAESRALWEKLYKARAVVETDEEARRVSNKVVEHLAFTYSDFSTLRALSKREDLNRPGDGNERGFELFQFYFDRSIAAVDAKGLGWGAHHGVDLAYMFGPDLALEHVFTEEERRFSEQMQTMWIRFAYGETDAKVANEQAHGCQEEEASLLFPAKITRPVDDFEYHAVAKEAIAFTDRFTVEKERVSRQGKDVFEFWEKSEKWVNETREAKRDSEEGLRAGLLCIALPSEKTWL